jgi:hypothetical protein
VGRKKNRQPDTLIDPLRQQIEHWRQMRAKRSPMPEPLWRAAVGLAREQGVYAAAQALRLSYDSLRRRTEAAGVARRVSRDSRPGRQPSATFVELPPTLTVAAPGPSGPIVEVVGPGGQRLTVRLRSGDLDVAELIRREHTETSGRCDRSRIHPDGRSSIPTTSGSSIRSTHRRWARWGALPSSATTGTRPRRRDRTVRRRDTPGSSRDAGAPCGHPSRSRPASTARRRSALQDARRPPARTRVDAPGNGRKADRRRAAPPDRGASTLPCDAPAFDQLDSRTNVRSTPRQTTAVSWLRTVSPPAPVGERARSPSALAVSTGPSWREIPSILQDGQKSHARGHCPE